jgi:thioredoxin-related protein
MKKIVLLLILSQLTLWSVEIYSYKEALVLQKKNSKIIMLDVVREGCHYCEDMEKNIFADPDMPKYLSEKFIIAKINISEERLPLGLKVNFTPTFFFINSNQNIVKTIPGSWSVEDFKDLTKGIK